MRLTDLQCRTLKPGKYADGYGLIFYVRPSGLRQFSVRSQVDGRDVIKKIGEYPTLTLAGARDIAHARRRTQATSVGLPPILSYTAPIARKRAAPKSEALAHDFGADRVGRIDLATLTFGQWVHRWLTAHEQEGVWTHSHAKNTRLRINRFLTESIFWNERLCEIEKPDVSQFLDSLHLGTHPKLTRGQPDTADKLKGIIGGVFRFAIGKGALGVTDPTGFIMVGTGKKRAKHNMPAIRDLNVLGGILRQVVNAPYLTRAVRSAILLLAYTAQRPGCIVEARWADFYLDGPEPVWSVRREDMKVDDPDRDDHVLPLAPEVVAILRALPREKDDEYLFPGSQVRKKTHLGYDALPKAFRHSLGLKGKMVPHGWRTAFSTYCHNLMDPDQQRHRFDYDVVEFCLDHDERPKTARDYHRARPVQAMRAVMNTWASTLARAQSGETIVQHPAFVEREVSNRPQNSN